MLKKLTYVLSTALLSTALACGGGDSGTEAGNGNGGGNSNENTPDTENPTILSTSPEVGATNVRADASVTIQFSEPMDKDSVEGTLDASDLGTHTIEWNDAGDAITIVPDSPLLYALGLGADPSVVDAEKYSVVLGNAATDTAGNPLGSGIDVHFSTLKELVLMADPIHDLSVSITPSEVIYGESDELVVGDTAEDEGVRATLTFDFAELPAEALEISEAYVWTSVTGDGLGDPWVLGETVLIDHVLFDGLSDNLEINAAFNSPQVSMASHDGFCDSDTESVSYDVHSDVQDDFENREQREDLSQFILYFEEAHDEDGVEDRVVFSRDKLRLEIRYLAE